MSLLREFVNDKEARSVTGPSEGMADVNTSTTVEYLNLTAYAGRYVRISVRGDAHYLSFGDSGSFTMNVGGATTSTAYVAFEMADGTAEHFAVPRDNPYLGFRAISGAGVVRVHPT